MKAIKADKLSEAMIAARAVLDRLEELARTAPQCGNGISLPDLVARLYAERRRRDAMFPAGIFGEPAWDLLLALYEARATGAQVTTTGAFQSAGVAQATGQRLIATLAEMGLVRRSFAPGSRKVKLVELTPACVERLSDYLAALI